MDSKRGAVGRQLSSPFHRVLGAAEHDQLHAAVVKRWGKWYGGRPNREESPSIVATLHVTAMKEAKSYEHLRAALINRGIERLFELREYGDGFEVEPSAASFKYNGAEGFWTSGNLDWLVYASHESSITFGGAWLVKIMRDVLPDFERFIYKGWDLALYTQRSTARK